MSDPTSWLQLLLRDASADELEAYRQALRDLGSDPEETDREARRALQLHAQLRERSQRATELSALSQMAARLSVVRDLPALLTDVAVLARQLLRTDVAYLALAERDDLRIRYFDGVLGAGAREIRLSPTAGLAGRVVASGQPAMTSDYLADASIEHLPQADTFAGEEGLQSILGVPLQAHGTVLGVLFAAERSRRPFSPSEVSLLAGLAGHAAVAIENAGLFEAERAAADGLRLANTRLQESASAVDRAIVLHERLTDAVVRGGGPAEVVSALSDVLRVPVQLVDAADRPLAGPDLGAPSPAGRFAAGDRRTVVVPGEGDALLVLCPVVAAEDYLGSIVVRGSVSSSAAADDAEVRLLERGALGIALSLVQQRAVAEAATRSRGELLTALVEGGEPDVLERRATAARLDLSRDHVLALVEADSGAGRSACAEVARRAEGLVVDRAGRTLLLVPAGTDLGPLAVHGTAGVSPPVHGAAALPEAYAAARRCLQAALALGRTHLVATPEALGVYRFLLGTGRPQEAQEFVQRTVGPLLEHDATKGTDLGRTVEEYLASGRQHTATAETLHIHPNTLYQRLARVGAVLGEGWREPEAALDLHVALRLHRLAAQLDDA
ncbi:MAG: diguanylate phosphodiesterase [Frankiales bacterium]|nr:diguanylate phosphodiesterase [Frankiales bacterium]